MTGYNEVSTRFKNMNEHILLAAKEAVEQGMKAPFTTRICDLDGEVIFATKVERLNDGEWGWSRVWKDVIDAYQHVILVFKSEDDGRELRVQINLDTPMSHATKPEAEVAGAAA